MQKLICQRTLQIRHFSPTLAKFAKEKKAEEKKETKAPPPKSGDDDDAAPAKPSDPSKEEGEWLLRDMPAEQFKSKLKKLIARAPVQPGSKGFGLEGHVLKGVAMFQGEEDPVIKSKESYPKWIFEVPRRELTEKQLIEKQTTTKLSEFEAKRLVKLTRKRKIKLQNMSYKQGDF
jgi:hypothetical protein